jgi:branched-chain amino acid transport system ATP-binding protein
VTALSPNKRAKRGVGRSFQNLGLIMDETVETNLLAAQFLAADYGSWDIVMRPRVWRRREEQLRAQAIEAVSAFGLNGKLHDRVADLSFGQSRFAELACVFAQRPRLMLLDEPTTGLDIRATERLRQRLVELRDAGQTILLVAHHVRFVMDLCDWVYVLASGSMLAGGPAAEVVEDERVTQVYLGALKHVR